MSSTDKKDKFIANFMKNPAADTVANQQQLREEAMQALQQLDFPTLKDERWKYTRVAGILKKEFEEKEAEAPADIKEYLIPDYDAQVMVFVNGVFQEGLSEIDTRDGVHVTTTARAKVEHYDVIDKFMGAVSDHKNNIFTAMNTGFHKTGALLYVEKDHNMKRPLHIIDITSGEGVTYQPRNLFVVEQGAKASVTHSIFGDSGESFTNGINEIYIGENASFEYQSIQKNGSKNNHIQSTDVYQGKESTFTSGAFTFGGKLVRNDINVVVNDENCDTRLNGAFLLNDKQHVDNHTVIDHRISHCESHENYKGILSGKSTGVFNGKVFVRPNAQKINAFQSNQNILLSDNAVINSKPELEIYADDVKCSHGSTTGQLDEEAMFYLMSRGLSKAHATNVMIKAFTAETLEFVSDDAVKEYLSEAVATRCNELNEEV